MPWIAVDCGLPEHPKLLDLPNDSARYGWIVTLAAAKRQRAAGSFASEAHFRGVVHGYAKYLKHYLSTGLLERHDDGSLHVHDWRRYQWMASKARQREDIDETSSGRSEDMERTESGHKEDSRARNAVPVPVYMEGEGEVSRGDAGGEPDAAVSLNRRTGQFPSPKIIEWLNELAETHGEKPLIAAIDSTPLASRNVKDYLVAIRDQLRSAEHMAEKAERADELRRNAAKRAPVKSLEEREAEYRTLKAAEAELLGRPA